MTKNSGSMRDKMPETAKFLDELREVFGAERLNETIRRQVHGGEDLGFWASEAGHTVGKRKNDGVGVSPVVDWSSRQAWEKKKAGTLTGFDRVKHRN